MITFISVSYLIKKFNLGSLIRPKSKQGALAGTIISFMFIIVWVGLAPLYISATVMETYLIGFLLLTGYFVILYCNSLEHLYKNCSI